MRVEFQLWLVFILAVGVMGWYLIQILYCPYWSKEPVLHTYDWMRRAGLLNSTWKRGMSTHKYVDMRGVQTWKAGESGFSGAVEKMGGFLGKEWITTGSGGDVSGGDGYTRTFTLSSAELEKGAGRGAVVSTFSLMKYPGWDVSFSVVSDISGGDVGGDGWMMTYPVYYWISEPGWSCGGVLGDILGGVGGRERSGETWKVDYLCVRRDMAVKERVEVVRKLFSTHLYRLVFPGLGGGKGAVDGIRRNSALFRADPMDESMRKVVPVVRFRVVEIWLDENRVHPLSKRLDNGRRKWIKVGDNGMSVMETRLWWAWLEGWYEGGGGRGGNGGAMGGFQMVGLMNREMWSNKIATGDWYVWVLFSPVDLGEGEVVEEITAVLFFRNERCLMEHRDEIRGMAGSGTEMFTLMGSWFLGGVSVKEGKSIFHWGLREMRRVRKTFRVLRVEEMGYNVGLLEALRVSAKRGSGDNWEIGRMVKQEWQAYYFYNRFWGELDAKRCFVVL